jgi:hypothetical protein
MGLAKGLSRRLAASLSGIHEQTLQAWFDRGGQEDAEPLYREAFEKIVQAEALAAQRWLDNVENASRLPQSWGAAAWLLERRFPQDYGSVAKVNAVIDQSTTNLTIDEWRANREKNRDDLLRIASDFPGDTGG